MLARGIRPRRATYRAAAIDGVIRRCLQIWTNPGDVVLSPFAGIGSAGYVALEMGHRFAGIELKPSYYRQAVANLRAAERSAASGTLLDLFDRPAAEGS